MAESSIAGEFAEPRARLSRELSRVAFLLALSIFINYIDRGNLSIAAPLIKDDLHLSAGQLGILLSSFFVTYALFQIPSGWLVDRFPVNWVLAVGVLLWSAATLLTGLGRTFVFLLAMRLILGAGESVSYPSYSKIIASHFPEHYRGRVNAVICAGQASGPALGLLFGGILVGRIGWRLFFVVLGVASSLWLLPWLRFMPKRAAQLETKRSSAADLLDIFRQRSAWGTFAGLFCYNYLSYFLITWLPFYLVRERGFSFDRMSVVSAVAFFAIAVTALISGWVADAWLATGASVTRVRKTFTGGGPILACCIVLVSVVTDPGVAISLLILACVGMGLCTSNLWAVSQTLAGPATAGKWTGLQNGIGNLAGWIAPSVTGFIVDKTGRFFWAFAITAMIMLLGSVAWFFVVGPIEEVTWNDKATS